MKKLDRKSVELTDVDVKTIANRLGLHEAFARRVVKPDYDANFLIVGEEDLQANEHYFLAFFVAHVLTDIEHRSQLRDYQLWLQYTVKNSAQSKAPNHAIFARVAFSALDKAVFDRVIGLIDTKNQSCLKARDRRVNVADMLANEPFKQAMKQLYAQVSVTIYDSNNQDRLNTQAIKVLGDALQGMTEQAVAYRQDLDMQQQEGDTCEYFPVTWASQLKQDTVERPALFDLDEQIETYYKLVPSLELLRDPRHYQALKGKEAKGRRQMLGARELLHNEAFDRKFSEIVKKTFGGQIEKADHALAAAYQLEIYKNYNGNRYTLFAKAREHFDQLVDQEGNLKSEFQSAAVKYYASTS